MFQIHYIAIAGDFLAFGLLHLQLSEDAGLINDLDVFVLSIHFDL